MKYETLKSKGTMIAEKDRYSDGGKPPVMREAGRNPGRKDE